MVSENLGDGCMPIWSLLGSSLPSFYERPEMIVFKADEVY